MLFDIVPVGAVLFAFMTLMAVAPFRRPRSLATVAWLSSCAPNEVPFLFLFILAISVGPSSAGGLSSTGDRVELALALATTVGLGVVTRRAWSARPALDQALATSLGAGWRDAIAGEIRQRLRQRRPWGRILLVPFAIRPRSVDRISDLAYGHDGEANRLDVYRHRSRPEGAPTFIHLHGGYFRSGRKSREGLPLLHHLASQGWTCISANYHLSRTPGDGFPRHLVDVKRVIAWARDNAETYGMDRDAIFLGGSSAGAHLTAMTALTANDPAFQDGFEDADTSVAGAVCFYGYYGALREGDAAPATTPLSYPAVGAPPMLVVHGDQDTFTPVEGARALVEHLRASSTSPTVLAELPGAQHSFDLFHSIRYEAVVDAVEAFAGWVRTRTAQHGEPSVEHEGDEHAARALSNRRT
jgi:acetyl esterase/lipase